MPYKKTQRQAVGRILTGSLAVYFETGFDFFGFNYSQTLWDLHKKSFMKKWMTFEPFQVEGIEINARPGARPHCWWAEHGYQRKIIAGTPAHGPGIPEQQFRCGCPRYWVNMESECESQATFLARENLLTDEEKTLMPATA